MDGVSSDKAMRMRMRDGIHHDGSCARARVRVQVFVKNRENKHVFHSRVYGTRFSFRRRHPPLLSPLRIGYVRYAARKQNHS